MKKFEKIRSKYITKIVFSYLNEKYKLKIVKYNLSLQNKLEIKLKDYKKISGRFIIYETPTKGKEYITKNKQLIYEGDFLHGVREGNNMSIKKIY